MDSSSKVKWITRTAVFTALLVVVQGVTAGFGNTLITGSAVNLILIVSVMLCGLGSGATVALISPILAKMFGIGPLVALVPFIMLGNLVLVIVWNAIGNMKIGNNQILSYMSAAAAGAVAKFLTLYIGIVMVAVPKLLELPEPQAAKISQMFSLPQLITAAIGGALACVILPLVRNAIGREKFA